MGQCDFAEIHAVLQAGGRGERMGEATQSIPKPLRPVAGTPMIERIIKNLLLAGVRRITVITGWLGDQIEAHVRALLRDRPEVKVAFIRETEPRGNAGSLTEFTEERVPLLFTFTDLVTNLDYATLLHRHQRAGCHLTLTSHYETLRLRLGELKVEGEKVVGYFEKPEKQFLICSGIAMIDPRVIQLLDRNLPLGLVDVVTAALKGGLDVHHWIHESYWRDVNSETERLTVEKEFAENDC